MKVVSVPKERINQSRRQLQEFLRLNPNERISNYRTLLKPAILRLLNVLSGIENGNSYEDIDSLKRDALHVDVEIVAFHFGENTTLSYMSLKAITQLTYPEFRYEIVDRTVGSCKDSYNDTIYYFKRIAVDYALESLAKRWLEKIPKILELL